VNFIVSACFVDDAHKTIRNYTVETESLLLMIVFGKKYKIG
jgi:hypothetical protein